MTNAERIHNLQKQMEQLRADVAALKEFWVQRRLDEEHCWKDWHTEARWQNETIFQFCRGETNSEVAKTPSVE